MLEKQILNNLEMDELLDMVELYKKFKNCGTSENSKNLILYNITLNDGIEKSVYCNCK